MATIRSWSGKGRGLISIACTVLKIAVFAPMPSARVHTAIAAKPGLLMRLLPAKRKALKRVSMIPRASGGQAWGGGEVRTRSGGDRVQSHFARNPPIVTAPGSDFVAI